MNRLDPTQPSQAIYCRDERIEHLAPVSTFRHHAMPPHLETARSGPNGPTDLSPKARNILLGVRPRFSPPRRATTSQNRPIWPNRPQRFLARRQEPPPGAANAPHRQNSPASDGLGRLPSVAAYTKGHPHHRRTSARSPHAGTGLSRRQRSRRRPVLRHAAPQIDAALGGMPVDQRQLVGAEIQPVQRSQRIIELPDVARPD
jgi:hypothetical protein